jgi:hypothetical protein
MNLTPSLTFADAGYALPLIVATGLVLTGCWNTSYALETVDFKPPTRPYTGATAEVPNWIPAQLNTTEGTATSEDDTDYHVALLPGPMAISIRKNPPQSHLVTDRATIRIDLRVGVYHGFPGLAELAAKGILDLSDGARNQPNLRSRIARLGGDIDAEVGAKWTRFTATVPATKWQEALRILAERLQRNSLTQRQFNEVQDGLIQHYLSDRVNSPLLNHVSQWIHHGSQGLSEVIQALEDRSLPEISLFQRRHYQPRGVAIGLWIPNSPKDPGVLLNKALIAVKDWQSGPVPPVGANERTPAAPAGVQWTENAAQNSEIALIIPLSPVSPESLTLMECLSMSGIGGRLGSLLMAKLGQDLVFQAAEIGNYNQRYSILTTMVPAKQVPILWEAAQEAWKSLASQPPIGQELLGSLQRARLRLQRRQDDPNAWFEAMGLSLMRGQAGGPVRDLARINTLTMQAIASTASKDMTRPIAMAVLGGEMPAVAGKDYQKVYRPIPDYNPITTSQTTEASAKSEKFLKLALQALGDRRQFQSIRGYRSVEAWTGPDNLSARVETKYQVPGQMSRELHILNTSIYSSVSGVKEGVKGEETVGSNRRPLSSGEARDLLYEAASHPIVLIAQFVQGKTRFRYIGVRAFEGRQVALLERVDASKPRLRISIDAETGLLRTVETTLLRSGVGLVQVRESYDDYRRVNGVRTPMHRQSSVDGQQTTESVYQEFQFLR